MLWGRVARSATRAFARQGPHRDRRALPGAWPRVSEAKSSPDDADADADVDDDDDVVDDDDDDDDDKDE